MRGLTGGYLVAAHGQALVLHPFFTACPPLASAGAFRFPLVRPRGLDFAQRHNLPVTGGIVYQEVIRTMKQSTICGCTLSWFTNAVEKSKFSKKVKVIKLLIFVSLVWSVFV